MVWPSKSSEPIAIISAFIFLNRFCEVVKVRNKRVIGAPSSANPQGSGASHSSIPRCLASQGRGPASTPTLRWQLFISLLVMLSLPLVYTLYTGVDHYSYFSIHPVGQPPWPLALAFVTSAFMALLAVAL